MLLLPNLQKFRYRKLNWKRSVRIKKPVSYRFSKKTDRKPYLPSSDELIPWEVEQTLAAGSWEWLLLSCWQNNWRTLWEQVFELWAKRTWGGLVDGKGSPWVRFALINAAGTSLNIPKYLCMNLDSCHILLALCDCIQMRALFKCMHPSSAFTIFNCTHIVFKDVPYSVACTNQNDCDKFNICSSKFLSFNCLLKVGFYLKIGL